MHVCVCVHAYVHACVHAYVHVCVCVCVCVLDSVRVLGCIGEMAELEQDERRY